MNVYIDETGTPKFFGQDNIFAIGVLANEYCSEYRLPHNHYDLINLIGSTGSLLAIFWINLNDWVLGKKYEEGVEYGNRKPKLPNVIWREMVSYSVYDVMLKLNKRKSYSDLNVYHDTKSLSEIDRAEFEEALKTDLPRRHKQFTHGKENLPIIKIFEKDDHFEMLPIIDFALRDFVSLFEVHSKRTLERKNIFIEDIADVMMEKFPKEIALA